jgi:hypothetical protein
MKSVLEELLREYTHVDAHRYRWSISRIRYALTGSPVGKTEQDPPE